MNSPHPNQEGVGSLSFVLLGTGNHVCIQPPHILLVALMSTILWGATELHYSLPQQGCLPGAYLGWASGWPADTEVCVVEPGSGCWVASRPG